MTGLRYVSHLGPSGYGCAARNYLLGLSQVGFPVTWTPLRSPSRFRPGYRPVLAAGIGDPELDPICNRPLDADTLLLHVLPELMPPWLERAQGRRVIGYCAWETDRLPAHWPDLLNRLDRVLVPSRWNREVFVGSGVTVPVIVVPHLADPPLDPGALPAMVPGSAFVFYTIGDWTVRKSLDRLTECFLDTFGPGEEVALVIKTGRRDRTASGRRRFPGTTRAALRRAMAGRRRPAVFLLDREVDPGVIAALHARGDCFVSLCRAEGWGLGAFQAAASGKPVVITGYGGHLDYLPADAAYLVDYRLAAVADANGGRSYTPDQSWAEPDLAHASGLMRRVFAGRDEARRRGRALAAHVAAGFGRGAVVGRLVAALAEER